MLIVAQAAEAGLMRDGWVPKDGHCLVNPDVSETRKAGADVARQAQDFIVATEKLAAEQSPVAPAAPASTATDTTVPAGMLGRSDGEE